MKKITLVCLTFCFAFISYSQSTWQWGKRGGSGGSGSGALAEERVIDMATDRNGNVYVLAVNNPGMANVDGRMGRTVRDRLTIASWSCNGTFRWMKNYGGASITMGRALAVDSLDGVYVTGQTVSNNALAYTYLDADTNLGNTEKKLFLVKYDTSGNLKWLKMPQPDTVTASSFIRPLDLVAAPNGDLYWFNFLGPGNYDANAFVIITPGYYVTRYNSAGNFLGNLKLDMVTTGGGDPANWNGITNAEASHFSRDHNSGRFYLTGQFIAGYGTLAFGGTAINATSASIAQPIYLTSFNSSGAVIWTKQSADSNYASTRYCRPVIDPQGNIYIGGDMYNGNTFAGHTFTNNLSIHTFPFVLSLDMAGNRRWATSGLPKDGAVAGYNIAYTQNTVGLAGYYAGLLKWDNDSITAPLTMSGTAYILLTRHNASTGAIIGMDSIPSQSSLNNYGTAITGDARGNFFVGGSFDYRLFPGRDTISSVGGILDWFVAKFGSSQCNCNNPVANFTTGSITGNTVNFNYTGSTAYTAISWNFGDNSPVSSAANPAHTYSVAGTYNVCVTVTNSCGTNTICKQITTRGVGISSVQGLEGLSFYPNPVTDLITVQCLAEHLNILIYDAIGKRVLQTETTGNKSMFNLSRLSPGNYFIRFTDNAGHYKTGIFYKK